MIHLRRAALAWIPALLLSMGGWAGVAHPIHSTLTRVSVVGGGQVNVQIRVFADDFTTAVARSAPGLSPAQAQVRYVSGAFQMWTPSGARVPLRWCGNRTQGPVIWVCLRGQGPPSLRGMRLLSSLQFALYEDQVNVVQVSEGADVRTLMFVPGDRAQTIR